MKFLSVILACLIWLQLSASDSFATGPAFTGISASAESAETVVTNPAGMTRFEKPALYCNPMVIYTKSETEVGVSGTNRKETIDNDSFVTMPGMYYLHPVNDSWVVGIGPNVTSGLGSSYDDSWAGRYFLKKWSLNFVGLAPAVACKYDDNLSIGVSIPVMYSMYSLEKSVFNGLGEADGNMKLEADGVGVGVTAGILYEFTKQTRMGINYRSKISVNDKGTPDFSGLTDTRRQILNQFGELNQEISFDTSTPQIVTAGFYHEFEGGWSLSADMAWVDFSDWGLENLVIGDSHIAKSSDKYQDIWAASFGVSRMLTPKWTANSGVFYLSSALEKEDRTPFSRFDAMWGIGFGCGYKINSNRSISFDLTYLQFGDGEFSESILGGAEIYGKSTTNYGVVFSLGSSW